MRLIPVAGPSITDKEVEYVTDAARNAWYEGAYDYIKRFEGAFADYLGLPYAISLPSGTGGIHLGLAAMGVGPGDEVIVPDITWIASASPIIWLGATPVFADVDPVSWCITPESFEECLTPRTKAVVVVDLYGNMPQMDAIREIASAHGVAILEDAAEAIGASYDGKLAGTVGAIGVFSFHGSKTMTTGEGGMLVTADDHLYRRCILLRDHGRDPSETQKSKKYWNLEIGYKYLMSPVLAALGLAQIERIDELVANKLRIFEWYRSRLGADDRVALNEETPGTKSSYWLVNAILDPSLGLDKHVVMERLEEEGVDTRPYFDPLSALPAFRDLPGAQVARERNSVAYRLAPLGVGLPSAHILTEDDVDYVCNALRRVLERDPALAP